MAGTTKGGLKAAKTIKARYGKDYFKKNGAKGGNPLLIEWGRKKREQQSN
jgi:hypothetical protein